MIHIVFNEADVAVLKEAIALDETLQGDIVAIVDDYAVGPLTDLYGAEGRKERKAWWRQVLNQQEVEENVEEEKEEKDDYDAIASVVGRLTRDENEIVWIWAAQNTKDVSGYYWTLHYLKPFVGRVHILYLNNLPFINDKGGIFYPVALNEIPPKEFLKAKKLARPITLSEFEVDPDEWTKLTNEYKMVRLLEGGKKLVQHDADFYDNELKKFVTGDFQKVTKVITQFQQKAKNTTGTAYLYWRLRVMAAASIVELQGKTDQLKDAEVRLKPKEE